MGGRKDPYLKFWVDDWRASADLRACSLSARAVWLEMLLYMHRHSPRRGAMLLPSGAAMTAAQLARDIAASEVEVEAALGELIAQRVCSVDEGGVIYCRRMAAESDISAKRAAAGEAGAKARWDGKPDGKKMANTGTGTGSGNGNGSGSSEGVQGEGTHEPKPDSGPPSKYTLTLREGPTHVPQALLDELRAEWPLIDPEAELEAAEAHLLRAPKPKVWTRRGLRMALRSWWRRADGYRREREAARPRPRELVVPLRTRTPDGREVPVLPGQSLEDAIRAAGGGR